MPGKLLGFNIAGSRECLLLLSAPGNRIFYNKEMRVIAYFQRRNGLIVPESAVFPQRPSNKGYGDAGASTRKRALKGFNAQSGSPREDIDIYNSTMRQRGRILRMATPLGNSAIKTNRTNVVGMGLRLKSSIDRSVLRMSPETAEAWQQNTEREFAIWAQNKRACDATGVNDFYAMQQLALMAWLESGDVFAVFKQYEPSPLYPYALRIHIIEADRVATPMSIGTVQTGVLPIPFLTSGRAENGNDIFDGVEVDENGMIVAYHIRNNYPMQLTAQQGEWARVLAYGKETGLPNIIQVMDSERPDQYRGVSYLAPVIEPLLQLRRYTESELSAAVIESFFTAFIKTTTPQTDGMPFNETGNDSGQELRHDPNEYSMGPGQINVMNPNESVDFTDPKRPSSGFAAFVRAVGEQVGASLEIPADLLFKSFNASYSASRAALLEAWKAFKMRREWFVNDFCRPSYSVWMAEAVARGRINAPGFFTSPILRAAYLGSEWIGPSQGQLDPVKEITAEILACAEGFSTHEQSTIRINGGEFDRNVEQLGRENKKLAEAQVAITTAPDTQPVNTLTSMVVKAVLDSIKEGENTGEKK